MYTGYRKSATLEIPWQQHYEFGGSTDLEKKYVSLGHNSSNFVISRKRFSVSRVTSSILYNRQRSVHRDAGEPGGDI